MEKVEGELNVFSPLLIGEYIRQMAAADYIQNPKSEGTEFIMDVDNYEKFAAAPLQTPLMGLKLSYDAESRVLKAVADERFVKQYGNKIMNDMALKYAELYKNRYATFIMRKD